MEDLTEDQQRELLDDLKRLHDDLVDALTKKNEGAKPVDVDEPIGRISRGDALQQQQMVRANKRSNEVRLKQVENALDAHRKGMYGHCRGCEGPIGYARLKAKPETPFCLECQKGFETR